MFASLSIGEVPISSTRQMFLTHNGEVFYFIGAIQAVVTITLNLDK